MLAWHPWVYAVSCSARVIYGTQISRKSFEQDLVVYFIKVRYDDSKQRSNMITISFQPGCVNTTEMDIRKCRRMKNPQKVKKVSLSSWFWFTGFVFF